MKKLLFIAMLGAATASVELPARAEAPLQIKVVPPKKGEVSSITTTEAINGTIQIDGKTNPLEQTLDEAYTQEILAVTGDTVTREKVSFKDASGRSNAIAKSVDLPVKGKAYVAAADGDKVTFTVDDSGSGGGAVTKDEEELLAKTVDNVGKPDKLGALFGARKFVKGEKVALADSEVRAIMGSNADLPSSSVTLTLTGSDGKRATFALAGKLSGVQNGLDMSVDFTGTATIDLAHARPVQFDLNGKIAGKGEAQGHKFVLDATLTGHRTASYR